LNKKQASLHDLRRFQHQRIDTGKTNTTHRDYAAPTSSKLKVSVGSRIISGTNHGGVTLCQLVDQGIKPIFFNLRGK
jgi:hypothetical protein